VPLYIRIPALDAATRHWQREPAEPWT